MIENTWVWVILAFLAGWVAEWIFDSLWLRRIKRVFNGEIDKFERWSQEQETEIGSLRGQIEQLEGSLLDAQAENVSLSRNLEVVTPYYEKYKGLHEENALAQAELDQTKSELDSVSLQYATTWAEMQEQRAELDATRSSLTNHERDLRDARTTLQSIEGELPSAKSELQELRSTVAQKDADLKVMTARAQESESLQRQLQAKEREIAELNQRIEHLSIRDGVATNDPLEKINGIGKAYVRALNEKGIRTFSALASLNPEQVTEIISPKYWQIISPDEWIAEAKQLAADKGLSS